MTSRDDVRRPVAGQTSKIPEPDQYSSVWQDYLQLGRRTFERLLAVDHELEVGHPDNYSLGWAGRSTLDIEDKKSILYQEDDLNSVESIALSPANTYSLSDMVGRRPRYVSVDSEESMTLSTASSLSDAVGRRHRGFSVGSMTSSPASSLSDTAGVGQRRPRRPVCCRFCKQNGESAEIYQSHCLKSDDGNGRVTCPILRRYTCPTCNATGDNAHTRRYCPMTQPGGRQVETGALWSLDSVDWDTRACQFEE